jgi:hypothetical protein
MYLVSSDRLLFQSFNLFHAKPKAVSKKYQKQFPFPWTNIIIKGF